MAETLLAFGFGYTAGVFARRLVARGYRIRGTSRDPAKRAIAGVEMHAFSRQQPLPAAAFDGVSHVLTSIAPDDAGDPVLDVHLADLQALPALAWVGYLGTTAVYGDRQGGWVDEDSPLAPRLARANRRAAAEAAWLASGLPVQLCGPAA